MDKSYILNDDTFWGWMEGAFKTNESGISKCMEPFRNSYIDPQYIIEISRERHLTADKSIMDNLRKYMPTGYFYEIHYCLSVYSTILGRIFPPLALDIEQLGYIEWLQFTEPLHETYRDHLVHIFKVAFVSDTFLSSPNFFSSIVTYQARAKHFIDWCKEQKIPLSKWEDDDHLKDVIKAAFFIAAIFHDIGYGYYHLQEYKQTLCKLYPWLMSTDNITFDIQSKCLMQSLPAAFIKKHHYWLNKSLIKDRTNNIVFGFFRDCLPINHSIASTLFILELVEKVTGARAISPELFTAFHLAAETIMIHDMIDKKRWLHLSPPDINEEHKETNKQKSCHFITSENQKQIPMAISMVLFDQLSRWKSPSLIPKSTIDDVNYRWSDENIHESLEVKMEEQEGKKRFILEAKKNGKKLEEKLKEELMCVSKQGGISFLDYDVKVT